MGLQEFYDKCGTEEKQRLKFPKAVLLVAPVEDAPFGDYISALHLDKAEVATTWTKPGVDPFLEVCAAEPAFVLQCGARFSRKFSFVASPQEIDDALRAKVASVLPDFYVNLHHHDEFSIKDGLGRVEKLCELLQAQRRSFCCITNHGSVGGWIRQYKACKEAKVKAIFGMEAYVGKYRGDDAEKKKDDRSANHLILLAKNREGFDNIIRIHNDAQLEGFYYVPRTNHEAVAKWGKGIIATSACMKGEIAEALMADDLETAQKVYEAYAKAFDQFYIELQIIEFEEQREANRRLIQFATKVGAPMILACDSHYLDSQHTATHDLLMLMRQGKTVYDQKANEEEVWNFQVANLYYRDAEAMRNVFENGFTNRKGDRHEPFKDDVFTEEVFAGAMANTRLVAVQTDHIKLDSSIKLPKLYDNSREMMRKKVNAGFRRRKLADKPDVQVYLDRVRYEYGIINKLGWTDYFLIMDRIVTDVKEKFGEWAIGYGRGSAAGSLVSYCLGLTDCDPIEHRLLFERFLDEGRPDPPDIDTDFDPRARDWVKDHIVEVFGEDNVCSIGTYSTYKTRAVILNVARALALDVMEANEVTKKLEPLRSFETGDGEEEIVDKMDFDDVCVHYPDLAAYLEKNPEVRYHSEIIRNQISNMGKHAAGVIISDSSLKGRIPVLTDASGGILSAWAESGSVQELSEVGLVKYDILGLNNLPIISDCIAFIEKHQGIKLRREDIPINDHTAIRQEARCDLLGIFQFENPATLPIVREVEMESLNDVAAITSLIRPGPKDMGMDMEYARRKHGQPYEVLDCIKHILAPTYGIIVYQEQMMQISQALCGFDGPKANKLRKACVTLDCEFVSKTRGPISLRRMLKEGYVDDLFAQKGDDGKVRWAKIESIWKTGKKRVRRTKSRSGYYVDATRLHQFLTDDGWKAQQRLCGGDRMVCARSLEWEGRVSTSMDFAIIVAGLLTEGYTPADRDIATFTSHDAGFMNVFASAFRREFGYCNGRLSDDGRVFHIGKKVCLKIYQVMGRGLSADKVVPDEMMALPREGMKVFLSFMLGAEGGTTIGNGTFEYSSKSERMIRQVRMMLLRFGVRSVFGTKEDKEYGTFYRLYVNDIQEQKRMASLTFLWPKDKVAAYDAMLARKAAPNFTTDTIPPKVVGRMLNQHPDAGSGESGTVYTSPISRMRFARIAKRTADMEWIGLAESDFWFDEYSDSDEVVSGHMDVYDFRVEDGSPPNMVVNGVVIHNCGKKKLDLMKSIKVDFVKGAKPRIDAGEVTLEQVENMWELIVKFAGYGFNLSHAITYSAITTVEIWLKHNYPTEYMAALCNNTKQGKKRHGSDNILVEYINYSRRRGMEILPPDVSESGVDFRIQGTAIRFSIGHVKNVATAAEAIETMQPFTSIEDFHNRVKATVTTKTGKVREQKLNKKVFESLLYAGAFDKFGTRNEVAAEYSRLRKKKGEEPIELTDDEWLDKEREVIGLVLSVEPMVKKYAALVKAMGAQTIGEEATRKKVRLFGRIASMTPHTSRNGNSMFKVYFEDGIDSIMFFVFEGGKQRFRDEFKIGDVGLMPLGRFDDGGQRFFDDNGPCKVFTKEELEDAEAGRLPQDENQDAG